MKNEKLPCIPHEPKGSDSAPNPKMIIPTLSSKVHVPWGNWTFIIAP